MWKHFFEHNEKILCCNKKDIIKRIDLLTSEDLRNLKSLESVKDYLERTKQTETTDKGFKVHKNFLFPCVVKFFLSCDQICCSN